MVSPPNSSFSAKLPIFLFDFPSTKVGGHGEDKYFAWTLMGVINWAYHLFFFFSLSFSLSLSLSHKHTHTTHKHTHSHTSIVQPVKNWRIPLWLPTRVLRPKTEWTRLPTDLNSSKTACIFAWSAIDQVHSWSVTEWPSVKHVGFQKSRLKSYDSRHSGTVKDPYARVIWWFFNVYIHWFIHIILNHYYDRKN